MNYTNLFLPVPFRYRCRQSQGEACGTCITPPKIPSTHEQKKRGETSARLTGAIEIHERKVTLKLGEYPIHTMRPQHGTSPCRPSPPPQIRRRFRAPLAGSTPSATLLCDDGLLSEGKQRAVDARDDSSPSPSAAGPTAVDPAVAPVKRQGLETRPVTVASSGPGDAATAAAGASKGGTGAADVGVARRGEGDKPARCFGRNASTAEPKSVSTSVRWSA